MKRVRVLLVDDSPVFLAEAARFLRDVPEAELVAAATSARGALEFLERAVAELVIVDAVMPGVGGLELTRLLKARRPAPAVAVITLHDSDEYRAAAREAGAEWFVSKAEFVDALPSLVRSLVAVTRGGT